MRGLLTKHEIVPTVGSERTMRDWQAKGLIARPHPVDIFGRRLRLYPEFALAQVMLAGRRSASESVLQALGRHARTLYESDEFRACADVLRRRLDDAEGTDIRSVTRLLSQVAADAVAALEEAVEEIELGLASDHGIVLSARVGRVAGSDEHGLLVVSIDGVERRYDRRHVAGSLSVGDAVRCDAITVGGMRDEYAVPTVEADRAGWKAEALRELVEAVDAVETGGELPSMRYTFLFSQPDGPRQWAQHAADRLRRAADREQWESFLGGELEGYAARHPSLAAAARPASAAAPAGGEGPSAGGDRWARWREPNLFA